MGNTERAVVTIVGIIAALLVVVGGLTVIDGESTHHLREVKVAACRTLDDQAARALCIEHA